MNIEDMLQIVDTFQRDTHGICHSDLRPERQMEYMRRYCLALAMEQAELLNLLPWKPWGYCKTDNTFDQKEATKEWCDCLIFLLDQALCLKLSPSGIVATFQEIILTKTRVQKRQWIKQDENDKTKGPTI